MVGVAGDFVNVFYNDAIATGVFERTGSETANISGISGMTSADLKGAAIEASFEFDPANAGDGVGGVDGNNLPLGAVWDHVSGVNGGYPVLRYVQPVMTESGASTILDTGSAAFTGTGIIGTTINIVIDAAVAATTVVDGAVNWTYTVDPVVLGLTPGAHTINATTAGWNAVYDSANAVNSYALTISSDTTDPVIDSIALASASDTGTTVNLTSDITPTISVNVTEANLAGGGVAVEIHKDTAGGALVGSAGNAVFNAGTGTWDFTSTDISGGGQGIYVTVVTVTDDYTNDVTSNYSFTLDSLDPVQGAILLDGTADTTTTVDSVTLSGQITDTNLYSATITVNGNNGSTADVNGAALTLDGAGNWSLTIGGLVDDVYDVQIIATDDAGNTLDDVAVERSFTVAIADLVAPVIDSVVLDAGSDTGISVSDRITADGTPTISVGITEENQTATPVFVEIHQGSIGGAIVVSGNAAWNAGNSSWDYTPADIAGNGDGDYYVVVTATDLSANTDSDSTLSFTLDTSTPSQGSILVNSNANAAYDTNTIIFSGVLTEDNLNSAVITINGVNLNADDVSGDALTVDVSGNWSYTFNGVADDTYNVQITATDVTGHVLTTAADFRAFIVDTVDPTSSAVLLDGTADVITDQTSVTLSGTITDANLASMTIDVGSGAVAPTTFNSATGAWTYNAIGLGEGVHNVSIVAVDDSDNTSTFTNTRSFTVDSIDPVLSSIGLTGATDTGSVAGITSNPSPTVTFDLTEVSPDDYSISIRSGSAAGAEIENSGSVAVGSSGTYTYNIAATLVNGTQYFAVITTADDAGNTITDNSYSFTIDTDTPIMPVNNALAEPTVTAGDTVALGGTAGVGELVSVKVDGSIVGTVTATGGNWTYSLDTSSLSGSVSITTVSTDGAGNTLGDTAALTLTVDAAPVVVVVEAPVPETPVESVVTAPAVGFAQTELIMPESLSEDYLAGESASNQYTNVIDAPQLYTSVSDAPLTVNFEQPPVYRMMPQGNYSLSDSTFTPYGRFDESIFDSIYGRATIEQDRNTVLPTEDPESFSSPDELKKKKLLDEDLDLKINKIDGDEASGNEVKQNHSNYNVSLSDDFYTLSERPQIALAFKSNLNHALDALSAV